MNFSKLQTGLHELPKDFKFLLYYKYPQFKGRIRISGKKKFDVARLSLDGNWIMYIPLKYRTKGQDSRIHEIGQLLGWCISNVLEVNNNRYLHQQTFYDNMRDRKYRCLRWLIKNQDYTLNNLAIGRNGPLNQTVYPQSFDIEGLRDNIERELGQI